MNSEEFHYGQVIRFFRLQRGMSVAKLASIWPGGPVDPRYVQRVEAGDKHIKDLDTLRQLADLIDAFLSGSLVCPSTTHFTHSHSRVAANTW